MIKVIDNEDKIYIYATAFLRWFNSITGKLAHILREFMEFC